MKKLLILAVAALFAFTSCEKNTTKIGNGEIVCNPSTLTVTVGETKGFTFSCTSSRKITEENPLSWTTMNLDGSKGDVSIDYAGNNTIQIMGTKVGAVTVIASVREDEVSSLVLGGVEVTVVAR